VLVGDARLMSVAKVGGDCLVVELFGPWCGSGAAGTLSRCLHEALAERRHALVNLRGCKEMDAATLSAIVEAGDRVDANGRLDLLLFGRPIRCAPNLSMS